VHYKSILSKEQALSERHPITVNGIILDEFLRDNESLEEEIEAKKYISEATEKVFPNRYIKPKYKDKKERNGKVIILGQREKNIKMYETELEKTLKANNIPKAVIIILLCNQEHEWFSSKLITSIIEKKLKEINFVIRKLVRGSVRQTIVHMNKNEIAQYIDKKEYYRSRANDYKPPDYRIKPEYLDTFTIEQAYALYLSKQTKPEIKKQQVAQPIPQEKTESMIETAQPMAVAESDDMNKLLGKISDMIKSAGGITLTGDIHIHINVSR